MGNKTRKVIGIGETVFDIIFKNNQPIAAKPGGSSFNALISLGRTKTPALFISDIGKDKVGDIILDFLKKNNINKRYVNQHEACKTAVSLAFLNDKNDAEYEFYKDYLNQNPHTELPEINENDIVLFGSFYGVNPKIRHVLLSLLDKAKANKAIIYYDPNFRKSHLNELDKLKPTILENIAYSTIVRGSDEDFENIFGTKKTNEVYQALNAEKANLLITRSWQGIDFQSPIENGHIPSKKIKPLSTIGAGDSFNAGFIYALIVKNITFNDISWLTTKQWKEIISIAVDFSTEVCLSYDNYISEGFAEKLIQKNKI